MSPSVGVVVRADGWRTVVPSGESEVFSFTLHAGSLEFDAVMAAEKQRGLTVKIRYVDLTGENRFTTSLELTELSHASWVAARTEIYASDQNWQLSQAIAAQGEFPNSSAPVRFL